MAKKITKKSRIDNVQAFMKKWLAKLPPFSFRQFSREGGLISILAISLPLLAFSKQDNATSETPEVLALMVFFIIIVYLLLATYWLWLKSSGERLAATLLAVLLLTTYYDQVLASAPALKARLGGVVYAGVMQLCVYILSGVVAKLAKQFENLIEKKKIAKKPLATIVLCICAVTFVFNAYAFSNYLIIHRKASGYKPKNLSGSNIQLSKQSDRDIYYFVFDRYASNDSLKAYFNFDNSQFLNELRQSGFIVRDSAYANYQYTAPSVSSTVRMDFHTDLARDLGGKQPSNYLPYKTIMENSPVASLLTKQGYDIYNFGNWWNPTRTQKLAKNDLPEFETTIFGAHFPQSELQTNIIGHTFLSGYLRRGLSIFGFVILRVAHADASQLYNTQVDDLNKLIKQPHNKPRYVFAHLLNPHPPYIFAADGTSPGYSSGDDNAGVSRQVKYISQLQYANATIKNLVAEIKQNSKTEPIIIIQADEGPYPLIGVADWKTAPADTIKLKMGILAAYNLPAVSEQEKAKLNSSVNAFRFVFNNYFGANLPYLPDCSYVYNGSEPFTYKNITPLLHPTSDKC